MMKKRIMGIVLLSTLLLSACSNGKDKEAETADSKVEQLDSRVTELESSSSSEEIESKYSKDEIKAYLNKDYNNEYTKEFINKAYEEGILLFYNGQLGVNESDDTTLGIDSYGPNGFLVGFFISENNTGNNVNCLISKYGDQSLFEDEVLRVESPEKYKEKYPNSPTEISQKQIFFNKDNQTELSIENIDENTQEKLVSIFNSFK